MVRKPAVTTNYSEITLCPEQVPNNAQREENLTARFSWNSVKIIAAIGNFSWN